MASSPCGASPTTGGSPGPSASPSPRPTPSCWCGPPGPLALLSAPVFPLTALGLADHYVEWKRTAPAADPGPRRRLRPVLHQRGPLRQRRPRYPEIKDVAGPGQRRLRRRARGVPGRVAGRRAAGGPGRRSVALGAGGVVGDRARWSVAFAAGGLDAAVAGAGAGAVRGRGARRADRRRPERPRGLRVQRPTGGRSSTRSTACGASAPWWAGLHGLGGGRVVDRLGAAPASAPVALARRRRPGGYRWTLPGPRPRGRSSGRRRGGDGACPGSPVVLGLLRRVRRRGRRTPGRRGQPATCRTEAWAGAAVRRPGASWRPAGGDDGRAAGRRPVGRPVGRRRRGGPARWRRRRRRDGPGRGRAVGGRWCWSATPSPGLGVATLGALGHARRRRAARAPAGRRADGGELDRCGSGSSPPRRSSAPLADAAPLRVGLLLAASVGGAVVAGIGQVGLNQGRGRRAMEGSAASRWSTHRAAPRRSRGRCRGDGRRG